MFYEIVIDADVAESGEPAWLISVPAFPEVTLFATSKAECLTIAVGGIEEAIAGRISDNEDVVPPKRTAAGMDNPVEVPLLTALKVSLYTVCRERGMTRAELSRILGWHREQVDRLFRLEHKSRIDQIEAAFKAVGKPLTFEVMEAA
jgi:antitoxin HicB